MVKVAAAEVTPPVVTVTFTVPAVLIRAADTGAVIFVLPERVGVSDVVPHFTVVPEVKFVPAIVSVNAGPPAVAELGLKLLIVDAGLMAKVAAAEVTPPVVTVTFTVPAVLIRVAETGAVIFVLPETVGVSDVVPHLTVAPEVKFVPVIVSVNAGPPAVAELGLKLLIVNAARAAGADTSKRANDTKVARDRNLERRLFISDNPTPHCVACKSLSRPTCSIHAEAIKSGQIAGIVEHPCLSMVCGRRTTYQAWERSSMLFFC